LEEVIFPEGRAGAATSTNKIRGTEDKLECSHWLFIFWSQVAQIVILSNKASELVSEEHWDSCGSVSSTLSRFATS